MRPKGTTRQLEDRRRRALALLDTGLSLHEVARRVECAPSSVLRWRDIRAQRGDEGLRVKSPTGRKPRLTNRQVEYLEERLHRGAMKADNKDNIWTKARVAKLIAKDTGIQYHKDHVGKILHALGWHYKPPIKHRVIPGSYGTKAWEHLGPPVAGWVPLTSEPKGLFHDEIRRHSPRRNA